MRRRSQATVTGLTGSGGGARSSRPLLSLLSALVLIGALMAVFAVAASAAGQTRVQSGTFGASASLGSPVGLAIDPANGEVYVSGKDTTASLQHVFKFDPSTGNLDSAFASAGQLNGLAPDTAFPGSSNLSGLATDPSNGDLYVADNAPGAGAVYKFNDEGDLITTFGDTPSPDGVLHGTATTAGSFGPTGVAVDPSNGDLYVADFNNSVIAIFSSTGVYKSQFDTTATGIFNPSGVAVDSSGGVFVSGSAQVQKFDATGTPVPVDGVSGDTNVLDSLGGNGLAIDPASDDVYVDEGTRIAQFDDVGAPVASFGGNKLSSSQGVAVLSGGAKAYATEGSDGLIHAFGALVPSAALTLTAEGTGTGSFSCDTGSGPEACLAEYPTGNTITVTATPNEHMTFDGWGGACSGTGSCVVSNIAADTSVSATFTQIQYTVTVNVTGSGTGEVNASSGPISACTASSGVCSGPYNEGESITLQAARTGHSAFTGWSGACTGSISTCELTVGADISVAAEFTTLPPDAVTYTDMPPINLGQLLTDVFMDQWTDSLYVSTAISSNSSIHKLDEAGTPLNDWQSKGNYSGVAADTTGLVFGVKGAGPFEVTSYDDEGNALPLLGFPTLISVAKGFHNYPIRVDAESNIYFANRISSVVKIGRESGAIDLQITCADCPGQASFTAPEGVAVDSDGSIYVGDNGKASSSVPARVYKFHPDGTFDSIFAEFPATRAMALAVNPLTHDVFVGSGADIGSFHIVGFDALGHQFADFGAGEFQNGNLFEFIPPTVAVSAATGKVFSTDNVLRVFAPDSILSAATEGAEEIGRASAVVNGIVNPNGGSPIDCEFEYGPTTSYGQSSSCAVGPGSASIRTPVAAELTGLSKDASYHYRVLLTTSEGTVRGKDQTFSTTTPVAPSVTTGGASSITQVKATLGGSVNPHGTATMCMFEYGASTSYGQSAPCLTEPGSGSVGVKVSAALTGLAANAKYHYRLSATNDGGTVKGGDGTFSTLSDTCQTKASLCPQPPVPAAPGPPPSTKPPFLQCRKGFKKATKHHKTRCVRKRKHKKHQLRANHHSETRSTNER